MGKFALETWYVQPNAAREINYADPSAWINSLTNLESEHLHILHELLKQGGLYGFGSRRPGQLDVDDDISEPIKILTRSASIGLLLSGHIVAIRYPLSLLSNFFGNPVVWIGQPKFLRELLHYQEESELVLGLLWIRKSNLKNVKKK